MPTVSYFTGGVFGISSLGYSVEDSFSAFISFGLDELFLAAAHVTLSFLKTKYV